MKENQTENEDSWQRIETKNNMEGRDVAGTLINSEGVIR
jgi:hypothetical protein